MTSLYMLGRVLFTGVLISSLVLESEEPSWLKAHRADGRTGLVPANYIEMLP